MAQLVRLSSTTRIGTPSPGTYRYEYRGEVLGTNSTTLFVDGQQGYVVTLEPNTCGFIRYTVMLAQSTSSGVFNSSNVHEIVCSYSVNPSGVMTLNSGAPTYGSIGTPTVPVSLADRLAANPAFVAVSRSLTNPYPHIRIQTIGGPGLNNWLIIMDVSTLPIKGV